MLVDLDDAESSNTNHRRKTAGASGIDALLMIELILSYAPVIESELSCADVLDSAGIEIRDEKHSANTNPTHIHFIMLMFETATNSGTHPFLITHSVEVLSSIN